MNIEDLLREAAPGANDLFLAGLPDPKDCHYTVSKRFERKMKKMLKRQKFPVIYLVQRSIACFLLVVLLGGTMVLTFSAEASAAFFGWVREVYEDYFAYHFEGEISETKQDVVYRPTWLPEGYHEALVPELDGQVNVLYESDDGRLLLFAYSTDPDIVNLQVAQKECTIQKVTVGNLSGDLYLDHEPDAANVLIWMDDQNGIIYWLSAHLEGDEMIKVAESVEIQD